MSAETPIDIVRQGDGEHGSLAVIEAAAVAMLEPLMFEPQAGELPTWPGPLADRADSLASKARPVGLDGVAGVADLVRDCLRTDDDAGSGFTEAGRWASGLIAFIGGHLDRDGRRGWLEDLRGWPGLGHRLDDAMLARFDRQLAADHTRLGQWREGQAASTDADETDPVGPEVGGDELQLLADACDELEELLQPVLAAWCADGDGHCADPDAVREAIEELTDRFGQFAAAAGFIGLDAVGGLLAASGVEVSRLGPDPAMAPSGMRRALLAWPSRWREAFRRSDDEAITAALELHREAGLGEIGTIDRAGEQWRAIRRTGSRRIARHPPLDPGQELSLAVADDTDPEVLAQLLRELPALSDALSGSMERLLAGDTTMFEPVRRAAHTLKGAANTAGIGGVARFTHALEDLLLLAEQSHGLADPVLADTLGESADTLAGMVDAVAGLAAPPQDMTVVYRSLLEWLERLPGVDAPGEEDGPAVPTAATAAALPAREPLVEPDPPAPEPAVEGASPAEADDSVLRVAGSLVDRLVDASTEAAIAVAQIHERLEELGRIRRAIRLGAQRARDLAREAENLADTLRRPASTGRSATLADDAVIGAEESDALGLARHGELDRLSGRIAEVGADGQVLEAELGAQLDAMADLVARLDRAQGDLRDTALRTRMIPVTDIAARLARAARQASRIAGKPVELTIHGRDHRFEARLLQALVEPLGHLIRNAVDHGIEDADARRAAGKPPVGRIDISFERAGGGQLQVAVEDDGRGLDIGRIRERAAERGIEVADWSDPAELARVLCSPDFSTRDKATQLSGRGLGMGLVAEAVAGHRGRLEIGPGSEGGFRVIATLPQEYASAGVLLLRSPSLSLAITVSSIEAIVPAHPVRSAPGGGSLVEAGPRGSLRLVALTDLLGLPADSLAPRLDAPLEPEVVLVLARPVGGIEAVRVPPPGAARQVLVHPLPAFMPPIPGLEGAVVLGDGTVAPVIDLSAFAQGAPRAPAPVARPSRARRPRCLVVDDSVSVRRAMQALASDLGLAVDSAGDGVDALALIDRQVPSIALIDLEMPRMNGLELARAMRARPETAMIPIIMLTSRASNRHRAHAMAAGVSHFLPKPFIEDDLSRLILDCLKEE
ncbi:MAG: response regulator [Burkholderiaceae bacterium]|nr:response regulator [Burkholderiaceae bacterium]